MSAPKHAFIYDAAREHQAAKFAGRQPMHRRELLSERYKRLGIGTRLVDCPDCDRVHREFGS